MNSSNAQEVTRQLNEDPALARKRRMELRRTVLQGGNDADGVGFKRQKLSDFGSDDDDNVSAVSATTSSSTVTSGTRKTPSLRGIKKQARYEPGVPMSRGELTEWRKEARRVRNRESAAASRAKTRERIEELEGELAFLRSKYVTALDRIVQLESTSFHEAFTPSILRQDLMEQRQTVVSPSSSPLPSQEYSTTSQFPQDSFSLDSCHHEDDPGTYQHIMGMISRPTAAKITGADTFIEASSSSDVSSESSSTSDCEGCNEDLDPAEAELGAFLWDAFRADGNAIDFHLPFANMDNVIGL